MYMPEYYKEKDRDEVIARLGSLVKHSDTYYSLDKYELRKERSEFDGANMWFAYYKDFGVIAEENTLEKLINEIIAQEVFDYGDPE